MPHIYCSWCFDCLILSILNFLLVKVVKLPISSKYLVCKHEIIICCGHLLWQEVPAQEEGRCLSSCGIVSFDLVSFLFGCNLGSLGYSRDSIYIVRAAAPKGYAEKLILVLRASSEGELGHYQSATRANLHKP